MQIQYETIYDLADFSGDCNVKPKIKPEYDFKTLYAVYEIRKDIIDHHAYGMDWMKIDGTRYKAGYYVIPCILWCRKWGCGDRVMIWPRRFCSDFGDPWSSEPTDVPREKWWVAQDFKKYFGLAEYMKETGNDTKRVENLELYDNVEEAIARAKELDKLLPIELQIEKIKNNLENNFEDSIRNLKDKLFWNEKLTRKQELQYEMDQLTLANKYSRFIKLYNELEKIKEKEKTIKPFKSKHLYNDMTKRWLYDRRPWE